MDVPDVGQGLGLALLVGHPHSPLRVAVGHAADVEQAGHARRVRERPRERRGRPGLLAHVDAGELQVDQLGRRLAVEVADLDERLVAVDRLVEHGLLRAAAIAVVPREHQVGDLPPAR